MRTESEMRARYYRIQRMAKELGLKGTRYDRFMKNAWNPELRWGFRLPFFIWDKRGGKDQVHVRWRDHVGLPVKAVFVQVPAPTWSLKREELTVDILDDPDWLERVTLWATLNNLSTVHVPEDK